MSLNDEGEGSSRRAAGAGANSIGDLWLALQTPAALGSWICEIVVNVLVVSVHGLQREPDERIAHFHLLSPLSSEPWEPHRVAPVSSGLGNFPAREQES